MKNGDALTDPVLKQFRVVLREVMDRKGFKQRYLADQIGMTYPNLNKLLTGKMSVSLSRAFKIVSVLRGLGVDMSIDAMCPPQPPVTKKRKAS